MRQMRIDGDRRLCGTVKISGHKNAAVALLPAALLGSTPSTLHNVPAIGDVRTWLRLLGQLGVAAARGPGGRVTIDPTALDRTAAPGSLASRMRASYYLLGALLGRCGRAAVPLPGGCNLGARPMDQHLKGFRALGAHVTVQNGMVQAVAVDGLHGTHIPLAMASVGATINLMLAAVLAEGVTYISNAAKEPHVCDVAACLNGMGARITGVGTPVLTIRGVRRLSGARHTVVPDDIEAATYLLAAVATGGSLRVEQVAPQHLRSVLEHMEAMGVRIKVGYDWIHARTPRSLQPVNLSTRVYPGLPTDAHPLFVPALCGAAGISQISEAVWPQRFSYVEPLRTMGARIRVAKASCSIEGGRALQGAHVEARDLRSGAALVIAGLAARGTTVVHNFDEVDRGYERMDEKLCNLGAKVRRGAPGESQSKSTHPATVSEALTVPS